MPTDLFDGVGLQLTAEMPPQPADMARIVETDTRGYSPTQAAA